MIFFQQYDWFLWTGMQLSWLTGGVALLTGYLMGSVNFAIIIARRLEHVDVRQYGSGNAGTSNITRTVGLKAGIMTLIGDLLKGLFAGLIGWALGGPVGAMLGGGGAFIGHCYPLYFGFKGGKGVATAAAAIFSVDWRVAILFLFCWGGLCLTTRMMGLGAAIGAWAFPAGAMLWDRGFTLFIVYCTAMACAIVFNHRSNIARMLKGSEPKATLKTHKMEDKYD